MTQEEWDKQCAAVKEQMAAHAYKFTTPISMSEDRVSAVAWASGSYLQNGDVTWLMTAEHTFGDLKEGQHVAHLPVRDDHFVEINQQALRAARPVDVAAVKVPAIPVDSTVDTVPMGLVAERFSAVQSELLFWIGYPGFNLIRHDPIVPERVKATLFGELRVPAVPMLSQELQFEELDHAWFDPLKHVAVHYPAMAKKVAGGPDVDMPSPKGISGSLLWNTRYLETTQGGGTWTPELAQVCGVIWFALDKPDVVFATRIEAARQGIPEVFA